MVGAVSLETVLEVGSSQGGGRGRSWRWDHFRMMVEAVSLEDAYGGGIISVMVEDGHGGGIISG